MMEERTLFDHILDRGLAHVIRFNTHPQHFPESVAEHSFYVAYFTSMLTAFLKKEGMHVDAERAVKIALVHDMEEVYSGDILTPFKHYNEHVSETIRKVNEELVPEVFEGVPGFLKDEYVALWKEDAAQGSIEANIVKVADKLALISKCYEEMKAGNEFFRPIYERELTKLYDREEGWWCLIREKILPSR